MTKDNVVREYLTKLAKESKLEYSENEPLSSHSSFKIGGPCAFCVFPNDLDTFIELNGFLDMNEIPFKVFGNATNVLFADEGLDCVVIFTTHMKNMENDEEKNTITCDCGVNLITFCKFAYQCGYKGFEYLYGIPGNIGGAVFMNAGAYEKSLSDVLKNVTYYDRKEKAAWLKPASKLGFSYRMSPFQDDRYVILSASFKLEKAENPDDVRALMDDHLKTRNEKQPLDYPSAGSVFKRYPGYYTSKLIDEAGLKGYQIGGAQVSEKHAGFIVNKGGATAKDVLDLIDLVKKKIYDNHGIEIECEVRYIAL